MSHHDVAPPIRVTAAVLIDNHKVLITQRRAEDRLAGQWEFPGGKIEADETPAQCLAREIHEELNIRVAVKELLATHVHHYSDVSIELSAFRVEMVGGEIVLREHADYCWADIDTLSCFKFCEADMAFVEMIQSGEIEI